MALGIGLHGYQYQKRLWRPWSGHQEPLCADAQVPRGQEGVKKSQAAKYRKRLKLAPWIEILIGCYFFAAILYTFSNHNYFTAPS